MGTETKGMFSSLYSSVVLQFGDWSWTGIAKVGKASTLKLLELVRVLLHCSTGEPGLGSSGQALEVYATDWKLFEGTNLTF